DLYGYIDDNRTLPDERVKTEFLGAVVKSKANDFTGALEGFLEVIRKNRYYNEDGARKACVAIFSLLGDQHSITKRYSRTLSNILY
ncbi:MAG: tetratricopeptide repeat protein, partial [SAR202 cluster bacterium]|nr:tetratricopeptide repeat protein [SAR202 cluster bacterium]